MKWKMKEWKERQIQSLRKCKWNVNIEESECVIRWEDNKEEEEVIWTNKQ